MALKLESNELDVSPDAAADGEAPVDSLATALGTAVGVDVAGGVVAASVGDGVGLLDEQPATMAATANSEIASFLVSKTSFLPVI